MLTESELMEPRTGNTVSGWISSRTTRNNTKKNQPLEKVMELNPGETEIKVGLRKEEGADEEEP
jgi:hypothetical protein